MAAKKAKSERMKKAEFWANFDDTTKGRFRRNLEIAVEKMLGLTDFNDDIGLTVRHEIIKGEDCITVESRNFSDLMKPKLFKELTVSCRRNGKTRLNDNGDEMQHSISLHLNWSHFAGGHNGHSLAYVYVNADGTFEFHDNLH
jgi:hypothetical protein